MSPTRGPVLEALSTADCRRLLRSVPIGRLAFTIAALPTIQPVHFAVRDDELLIPARRGGSVAVASRGSVVAFEVDGYEATTRTGWSVTLVGPARVLTDAVEVARLHRAGLEPWAPEHACVVTVHIARISGRQLA